MRDNAVTQLCGIQKHLTSHHVGVEAIEVCVIRKDIKQYVDVRTLVVQILELRVVL